jgi:hypothetical protein
MNFALLPQTDDPDQTPIGIIQIQPAPSIDLETNRPTGNLELWIRGMAHRKDTVGFPLDVGPAVPRKMGITITGVAVPIKLPPNCRCIQVTDEMARRYFTL